MGDLLDKLEQLKNENYVPMHMPGGKRNSDLLSMSNPYSLDITEIDGFDNLHHADGIIREGFERAARLYGADETLFLVNGSSAGIMAAICGATHKSDKVIVARNVHRSVMNALYLRELEPIFIYPELFGNENQVDFAGAISLDAIKSRWEEGVKVVLITSPTYEGVVSDVKGIAEFVHSKGAVLIVDEAHGAHFRFHDAFPESAVNLGADAVIHSIHKTMPALTQTALLHLNYGYINVEKVKMYWDMFQSTSPSYILLGSIDRCLTIVEDKGDELFSQYVERLEKMRARLTGDNLKILKLIPTDDISKIVIAAPDGKLLYDRLREDYHIQLEMASLKYVIGMTSVADTDEYYERFVNALKEIDAQLEKQQAAEGISDFQQKVEGLSTPQENSGLSQMSVNMEAERRVSMHMAMEAATDNTSNVSNASEAAVNFVDIEECVGRIAAESICFYPPGIAYIAPGEAITQQIVDLIKKGVAAGLEVMGIHRELKDERIKILCLK